MNGHIQCNIHDLQLTLVIYISWPTVLHCQRLSYKWSDQASGFNWTAYHQQLSSFSRPTNVLKYWSCYILYWICCVQWITLICLFIEPFISQKNYWILLNVHWIEAAFAFPMLVVDRITIMCKNAIILSDRHIS